jgi:hypothetical protein
MCVATHPPATRTGLRATTSVAAKLNDVDPRAWLADVLARIGDHLASYLD